MNQRKNKIELEVDQTLAVFGQTEGLKAGPWFAERVRARLTGRSEARGSAGWYGLLGLRPALVALMIALNVVTAVAALQRSETNASVRESYVESFASEYAYSSTDMLFELNEP